MVLLRPWGIVVRLSGGLRRISYTLLSRTCSAKLAIASLSIYPKSEAEAGVVQWFYFALGV